MKDRGYIGVPITGSDRNQPPVDDGETTSLRVPPAGVAGQLSGGQSEYTESHHFPPELQNHNDDEDWWPEPMD